MKALPLQPVNLLHERRGAILVLGAKHGERLRFVDQRARRVDRGVQEFLTCMRFSDAGRTPSTQSRTWFNWYNCAVDSCEMSVARHQSFVTQPLISLHAPVTPSPSCCSGGVASSTGGKSAFTPILAVISRQVAAPTGSAVEQADGLEAASRASAGQVLPGLSGWTWSDVVEATPGGVSWKMGWGKRTKRADECSNS